MSPLNLHYEGPGSEEVSEMTSIKNWLMNTSKALHNKVKNLITVDYFLNTLLKK